MKAFLQVGHTTFFSPVCFLPWRAAWPEVVKVSVHLKAMACGQGYFFLPWTGALVDDAEVGVAGSGFSGAEGAMDGVDSEVADATVESGAEVGRIVDGEGRTEL